MNKNCIFLFAIVAIGLSGCAFGTSSGDVPQAPVEVSEQEWVDAFDENSFRNVTVVETAALVGEVTGDGDYYLATGTMTLKFAAGEADTITDVVIDGDPLVESRYYRETGDGFKMYYFSEYNEYVASANPFTFPTAMIPWASAYSDFDYDDGAYSLAGADYSDSFFGTGASIDVEIRFNEQKKIGKVVLSTDNVKGSGAGLTVTIDFTDYGSTVLDRNY
ncbi:MAG TPA: hypothetical protein IAC52_03550 [Candidatus Enteromonas pullicola]|uniref:Lipoprotein n=1 Tax=Candidatus Alloenteromonas pullicola TaxID=2840784 RepID=A0A9D1LNZ7_9FIRM|nr:hypothetical protein [Candidatus Enteromonas pullicola]